MIKNDTPSKIHMPLWLAMQHYQCFWSDCTHLSSQPAGKWAGELLINHYPTNWLPSHWNLIYLLAHLPSVCNSPSLSTPATFTEGKNVTSSWGQKLNSVMQINCADLIYKAINIMRQCFNRIGGIRATPKWAKKHTPLAKHIFWPLKFIFTI